MDEERRISLRELERNLGCRFHEIGWLDQALTHKSFAHEQSAGQGDLSKKAGNEVLEFLGDAVLNLAVSHLLLQKLPDAGEGTLTKRRAHLVRRSSLAHLSKDLRLADHLLLGKGEQSTEGRGKSSILANAYEALIGAIYMDSGFDQTLEIVRWHLEPYLLNEETPPLVFNDYKSLLQEQIQRIHGMSPQYRVLKESGPDHDKRFQASVTIGEEVRGTGWGKSKKEAEQEAAKKALEGIDHQQQTTITK